MEVSNSTTSKQLLPSNFLLGIVIFKSFCIVCGVLGNLGVIIFNIFLNNSKTPTTYLVVNLAVADLLACLTIYPIWIIEFVQIITGIDGNETFFCKFSYSSATLSVSVSVLTLLAISFDRFLFITWPLKYPMMMTWLRVYILLCAIWVSVLLYQPLLILYNVPSELRGVCQSSTVVTLVCVTIYVYLPITLIFFFNYKIFKLARDQRRKIAETSLASESDVPSSSVQNINFSRRRIIRELKVIKTFAIVIGAFLFCLTPFSIVAAVDSLFCKSCVPLSLVIILGDLAGVNSILNPFIYSIRHAEYRTAFRRHFLSLWSRCSSNGF